MIFKTSENIPFVVCMLQLVCYFLPATQGLTAEISPKTLKSFRNDYAIFKCLVTGDPTPVIRWYRNDEDVTLNQLATIQKIKGGSLIRFGKLHHIRDNGTMACKASNGIDPDVTDTAFLKVYRNLFNPSDPNLPDGYPKPIYSYNPNIHVVVGTNVLLNVNVSGNPEPTITWFHNNRYPDWSNPRLILLKNHSLLIRNIQPSDIGRYDYIAENDKGRIFSKPWGVTTFIPQKKPVFVSDFSDRLVDPETTVILNCTATGSPEPKTEWKDSKVNVIQRNGAILTISNIKKSETYRCFAYNTAGSSEISVKVIVREVPFAPVNVREKTKTGNSITVTWDEGNKTRTIDSHIINYRKKGSVFWISLELAFGGVNSYTIRGLDAYTDYEIQLFSKNRLGTSKGSDVVTLKTDETAPGSAPRDILVKATGETSIEVSWRPPLYPNGLIESYTIYYTDKPHEDYQHWRTLSTPRSPLIITSRLIYDHRYAVAISARTATGSGPLSKHFLVQTLRGAPSDPQKIDVKVISSTSVDVSWSKPIYDGGGQGIIGYEVLYNVSSTSLNKKVAIQSSDDFKRTITGLHPYTWYQFAVAAKTDAGSGPVSVSKIIVTTEDLPSGPPLKFHCTAGSSSKINCTWQPPSENKQNGKITGYNIVYFTAQQHSHSKAVDSSTFSLFLNGLQPYTIYHIKIAAKTRLGLGPYSNTEKITTHEDKPSKPPENIRAEVINSTTIYLSWKAPSSPFGGKLVGYTVHGRRYPDEPIYERLANLPGEKESTLITGLEPETVYEFVIALRSGKGQGTFSDPIRVKTKQSPPLPPILNYKILPQPKLGVRLSWRSTATDIDKFRLRYAKEVKKIQNITILRNLTYVEKLFRKSETTFTYSNFEHGLWYIIKLSVKNPGGWSPDREIWISMRPAKPSGKPLQLNAEAETSTSLRVSWQPPAKWKRNGEIIGYRVSYLRENSDKKMKDENVDKKMFLILNNLDKFTSYKIYVRAKTTIGEGPAAEVVGKTKQDAPSTPPKVTEALGMGTQVVLLKFSPPSSPNGLIVGYKTLVYLDYPKPGVGVYKDKEIYKNAKEMYIAELIQPPENVLWFKIAAKTVAGFGPYSDPVKAKLLTYDLPLPVRQLSLAHNNGGRVKITWLQPYSTGGVRSYQFMYSGQKTFRSVHKKSKTLRFSTNKTLLCCDKTSIELDDLEPNLEYTLKVVALGLSKKSDVRSINFTTRLASSPPFHKPKVNQSGITENYIPIYLNGASGRNGPVSYYLVYVAPLGGTLEEAKKKLRSIERDARSSRTRRATDANGVYITGKILAKEIPKTFKVGQEEDVNGYKNKKLILGQFYAFTIQSCVLNRNKKCLTTRTGYTDIIQFLPSLKRPVVQDASNDTSSSGSKLWLLGPVAGVLLIIILIVVMCLLWRRRRRRRDGKRSLKTLSIHDENLPMMTSPKDPVDFHRSNLKSEGMKSHPPIHISELAEHIADLRAENNNLFTREYESIDPGMTFFSEASARHLNQSKNRYPNIVPYDHTRVMLQDTNGFLDSDYINANIVAGYRNQNAYIATQAPLSNTINDFWQMVWEQDTRTIVMMTNIKEKGRTKCDQYWPKDTTEKFGYITVAMLETIELAHSTVRTFRLYKDGLPDQAREIKHFQYTAWPEQGVPYYSTSLLAFIRKVRMSNTPDTGPIIVHCSAGVGRTAVFIVVDSMLERIRKEQTVDVYGHVTLLRSQRNHMVQTEDQYIFIHETLLEAVRFGQTEIPASDLSAYYKKLNEIGDAETTNLEEHFRLLTTYVQPHRVITAALPVNKTKNRFPKIIPYEHSKVDLVPVRGIDGSNYINASYIDGYKHRKQYIAAQGPLDETVNDFWRMIMEKKSNIIVMLSGTSEHDQEITASYWPTDQSAKYHFYIVDPVSVEETPNFTLRQFKVNDMMGVCPSLIKIFQLRKWCEGGKNKGCKELLDLIGQVHTARNNDENKAPIVVHCSSGSGRTGVFCALSIVVERMRAEGVIDLLQTVRQLQHQRPKMVETLEQYSFCYETALQYLTSFDHFS